MNAENTLLWNFQRLGGLDQVTLRTSDELRRLRELDPKLWTALSCPASGLEMDARMLALVDTDNDGRIRIPEILEAVEWLCLRLEDPAAIADPADAMPLALIREDNEEGRRVASTARVILENLNKGDAGAVSREDVAHAAARAAENLYNGDGILPPLDGFGPDVKAYIEDVLAVMGGVTDAGGQSGINLALSEAFMKALQDMSAWRDSVHAASAPLGGDTPAAWDALQQLREKIDDYFLRCDLATFAPERPHDFNVALESQAEESGRVPALHHGLLDIQTLAELPLARVEGDLPLRAGSGVNPAWRKHLQRFFVLFGPLMSSSDSLDRQTWESLKQRFEPYAKVLAAKPIPEPMTVDVRPTASLDSLPDERLNELLNGVAAGRFAELAAQDAAAPATSAHISEMERLVLYYLHLHRLLMNFVSFYDFYSLRHSAIFQSGTLYLDGRACRLCLPVTDQAAHSTLAAYSQLCLLYCNCRRKTGDGDETMQIVAAMTAGDADLLVEGRNGVFVDTEGRDWDATLVTIVSNPISIWQALWQPYKRLGRMITEQISKFAGARQADLEAKAAAKAATAGTAVISGAPAAPGQPFDIGKSVGIFAAIGLAIGAIGTAVAGLAAALFSLQWWQFPLLFLGLFLIISGPSFVLAWLKLRKRNLGPLLEASGWAVNKRIPVNLNLGASLTSTASLPPNSARSYRDPLQKRPAWPWVLIGLLVATLVLGGAWLWANRDELAVKFQSENMLTPDNGSVGRTRGEKTSVLEVVS